jgi:DNA-binding GntR family transcriptional regulator
VPDQHTGPVLIERGTLHDEAVGILRAMIIENVLPPGARIGEIELSRQLGISRTPLREAIRVLTSEGLVTTAPRRGAVVATPDAEEIEGIFHALGAIEQSCARLACERIDPAQAEAIEALHGHLLAHHAAGQRKEYYRANDAIHRAIVAAAGNAFLARLHESLSRRILRIRFFLDTPVAAWDAAVAQHEDIIGLLRARDGVALGDLLLRHSLDVWRDYAAG